MTALNRVRGKDRAYNDFEAGRITYDEFERIIYELDERVLKRPVVNCCMSV